MITKDFPPVVIKEGCVFFEGWVRIIPFHHMEDASQFIIANQNKMSVYLVLEPTNNYDKNAIKVIGSVKKFFETHYYFIGYVPKEISAHIYKNNYQDKLEASLVKISYEEDFYEYKEPSIKIIISIFVRK